jgi:hypothetical protein
MGVGVATLIRTTRTTFCYYLLWNILVKKFKYSLIINFYYMVMLRFLLKIDFFFVISKLLKILFLLKNIGFSFF